ncbi:Hypothetical predicted protein, partial [Pelobates cultripes]
SLGPKGGSEGLASNPCSWLSKTKELQQQALANLLRETQSDCLKTWAQWKGYLESVDNGGSPIPG